MHKALWHSTFIWLAFKMDSVILTFNTKCGAPFWSMTVLQRLHFPEDHRVSQMTILRVDFSVDSWRVCARSLSQEAQETGQRTSWMGCQ